MSSESQRESETAVVEDDTLPYLQIRRLMTRSYVFKKKSTSSTYLVQMKEVALALRIQEGDTEAKQELAEANLRLVVSIGETLCGTWNAILGFNSRRKYGLNESCEKFDPKKGFKFSTYATWWIRQANHPAIADQARTTAFQAEACTKTKVTQTLTRSR